VGRCAWPPDSFPLTRHLYRCGQVQMATWLFPFNPAPVSLWAGANGYLALSLQPRTCIDVGRCKWPPGSFPSTPHLYHCGQVHLATWLFPFNPAPISLWAGANGHLALSLQPRTCIDVGRCKWPPGSFPLTPHLYRCGQVHLATWLFPFNLAPVSLWAGALGHLALSL
jgi:hypothetical protein